MNSSRMCLPCAQSSSSTMTEVEIANQPAESKARNTLVLKLKGTRKPSVSWAVDTVNNENMKKKSSKRCCIFHRKKNFAESDSDESDSDTEIAKKSASKSGQLKAYQRHHA